MAIKRTYSNSHAVRWHCTAKSERKVADIKKLISLSSPDWSASLWPSFERKTRSDALIEPNDSTATGWKMWWAWIFEYFAVLDHIAVNDQTGWVLFEWQEKSSPLSSTHYTIYIHKMAIVSWPQIVWRYFTLSIYDAKFTPLALRATSWVKWRQ